MKPRARLLAFCLGALVLPACLPFAIFEDVGTDPHPPEITLIGMAVQPPAPAEGETARPPVFLPAEGFLVRPFDDSRNTFVLRLQFTDAGGDVLRFRLRDRDGALDLTAAPSAPEVDEDGDGVPELLDVPEFFLGTLGVVDLEDLTFEVNQAGTHRIELWAEDSHDSRSEKIEFTIEVEL